MKKNNILTAILAIALFALTGLDLAAQIGPIQPPPTMPPGDKYEFKRTNAAGTAWMAQQVYTQTNALLSTDFTGTLKFIPQSNFVGIYTLTSATNSLAAALASATTSLGAMIQASTLPNAATLAKITENAGLPLWSGSAWPGGSGGGSNIDMTNFGPFLSATMGAAGYMLSPSAPSPATTGSFGFIFARNKNSGGNLYQHYVKINPDGAGLIIGNAQENFGISTGYPTIQLGEVYNAQIWAQGSPITGTRMGVNKPLMAPTLFAYNSINDNAPNNYFVQYGNYATTTTPGTVIIGSGLNVTNGVISASVGMGSASGLVSIDPGMTNITNAFISTTQNGSDIVFYINFPQGTAITGQAITLTSTNGLVNFVSGAEMGIFGPQTFANSAGNFVFNGRTCVPNVVLYYGAANTNDANNVNSEKFAMALSVSPSSPNQLLLSNWTVTPTTRGIKLQWGTDILFSLKDVQTGSNFYSTMLHVTGTY